MTDYLSFNIILDDIVFPDGQTQMGVLGGGGPQTAFGMRLWSDSVGIIASVGPDLPTQVLDWFRDTGIDSSTLRQSKQPTPRAWQVMEADGRRTQVWRVPFDAVNDHLGHEYTRLLSSFQGWRGSHLGIHPLEPVQTFLNDLRASPGLLSLETFKPTERLVTSEELHHLASLGNIFSLNLMEAQSLMGFLDTPNFLSVLLNSGASVVVLRLGGDGCLVAQKDSHQAIHIPAVPTQVVDTVGAGNAFCGAFLVTWDQSHDLARAAASGAAAASFLVEQVGLPTWNNLIHPEAERRMRFALDQVHFVSLS
jgi:sugar/nucleoside kinase (ribokinase family)